MSATAPAPPAHADANGPAVPDAGPAPGPARLPSGPARMAGFLVLGFVGLIHWEAQLAPAPRGELVRALGLAAAAGLLLLLAGRLAGRARATLTGAVALGTPVGALAVSGIQPRLLWPAHWPDLSAGVGQGLAAVPNLRVPYEGLDEWTRLVVTAGGSLLVLAAALLAFWPRREGRLGFPLTAAAVLLLLYAVPIVEVELAAPLASGALVAAAAIVFLLLERVPRRGAPAAAALAAGALAAGLLAAPLLDRDGPLLPYRAWALSVSGTGVASFNWEHGYGPINWPRTGREVLRVRSGESSYWKTQNLDRFDGIRWVAGEPASSAPPQSEVPVDRLLDQRWMRSVRFTVRSMRLEEYVGAGTTLRLIPPLPRSAVPGSSPGTFRSDPDLRRGDAYRARVYTPRPTPDQLRGVRSDPDPRLTRFLGVVVPGGAGRPEEFSSTRLRGAGGQPLPGTEVTFEPFGSGRPPALSRPRGALPGPTAERVLAESPYARSRDLARRLAGESRGPFDFARRVEAFLGDGFSYSENPPRSAVPLDSFLFDHRTGYCQQFSGAMALLLRMGGVPARVASGFAPGSLDRGRGEYVVRDIDAHSWVEVWFAGYGWVAFDPTPAVAPARARAGEDLPDAGSGAPGGDLPGATPSTGSEAAPGAGASAGPAPDGGSGLPAPALLALGLLGLVTAAGGGAGWRRLRDRRLGGADPVLAELARALCRSGRAPEDGTTLSALERSMRGAPEAASYVRRVRDRRYGRGAPPPSAGERRALRTELARGRGARGWARAWWALPPRWPHVRRRP